MEQRAHKKSRYAGAAHDRGPDRKCIGSLFSAGRPEGGRRRNLAAVRAEESEIIRNICNQSLRYGCIKLVPETET